MRWQMTPRSVAGELTADLFALVRLEKIQDARDGLGRRGGVQRGQNQMPRVRRAHGRREADGVAHFAEHDDVRILPQNVFQRVMKGLRVEADLALFDHGLIVFKNKFNRDLRA